MKLSFGTSIVSSLLCTLGVATAELTITQKIANLRRLQPEQNATTGGPGGGGDGATEPTLVDLLVATPDYSTLVTAVTAAGLVEALSGPGPFTVFGPNDAAFGAFPEGTLTKLLEPAWLPHLTDTLLFHSTDDGAFLSSQIPPEGATLTMLNGEELNVTVTDAGGVVISQFGQDLASVNLANVNASNGFFHGIDTVLLPRSLTINMYEEIAGNPDYSTLLSLIDAAGLGDTLETTDLTLFAPSNDAFSALDPALVASVTSDPALLSAVLTYHALPEVISTGSLTIGDYASVLGTPVTISMQGDNIFINEAEVDDDEIPVANGMIIPISAVLLPPAANETQPAETPVVTEPVAPDNENTTAGENLVETLVGIADYSTLVTAVTTAGLVEALSAPDALLTVFGPNNDAFAAIPEEVLGKLLTPPWSLHLVDILLYHATSEGAFLSTDISADGATLNMLNGESIDVALTAEGGVTISVNGSVAATVILPNIEASNGAFHGIDAVLLPSTMRTNMYDALSSVPDLSTLKSLIDLAGLQETLATVDLTAFAPTNTAFEAIDAETIAFLTDPANVDALTSILTYHVLPEVVTSASINETSYTTVNGADITVEVTPGGITINGVAGVSAADNLVSNGVVHLIDAVLLPPTTSANDTATDAPVGNETEPVTDVVDGGDETDTATDVVDGGDETDTATDVVDGGDETDTATDAPATGEVPATEDATEAPAATPAEDATRSTPTEGSSGASQMMGIMGAVVCVVFSILVV